MAESIEQVRSFRTAPTHCSTFSGTIRIGLFELGNIAEGLNGLGVSAGVVSWSLSWWVSDAGVELVPVVLPGPVLRGDEESAVAPR